MDPELITSPSYFSALADSACVPSSALQRISLLLKAEVSQFIRFNHAQVRQATAVRQAYATLAVVDGGRRIETTLSLSGKLDADCALLCAERDAMIVALPQVPVDSFLLLPDTVTNTDRRQSGRLPAPADLIATVCAAARGLDLVGFYAAGPMVRGFADNRGQRNWHAVESFHFDWCVYQSGDKAVKTAYAGTVWDADEFAARLAESARRLPLLARAPRVLRAGNYRAYFAPPAVGELLGMVAWSGFGTKHRRTGTSSLMRLADSTTNTPSRLHPDFHLREATASGLSPDFTDEGFVKPEGITLIESGAACDSLISPRSAREFSLTSNGANAGETPESMSLAPGKLDSADALRALDTGMFVSDLWYLNYSDRAACRLTGMTRFACFWVESGQLVEPLQVMRFDDSFLRMFGKGLLGLTKQTQLLPDNSTYGERQLASVTAPGALVEDWQLTL
ncbi:MAG: metallopeptidase TldD-related protein [Ideonella sp.]